MTPFEHDRRRVIGYLDTTRLGVNPDEVELGPHVLVRQRSGQYGVLKPREEDCRAALTSISSSMLSHSLTEMGTESGIRYKRSSSSIEIASASRRL